MATHHLEPAPLLPSSDELLKRWISTMSRTKLETVALEMETEIKALQSELASLRAHGDAEWNAGRDAAAKLIEENSEYVGGAGAESVRGMRPRKKGDLMAMGYAKAIRALTRPTTPSPDEAKGGE